MKNSEINAVKKQVSKKEVSKKESIDGDFTVLIDTEGTNSQFIRRRARVGCGFHKV